MNFCIELNNVSKSELQIDSEHLKKYLNIKYNFLILNEKQLKKKLVEIINNEDKILQILDDLDICYQYFIEMSFIIFPTIFTKSFINKYVKTTYIKYKKF